MLSVWPFEEEGDSFLSEKDPIPSRIQGGLFFIFFLLVPCSSSSAPWESIGTGLAWQGTGVAGGPPLS